MKVTVIGQGYVGLTVAFSAAKAGHTVIGIDSNQQLIEQLKIGKTFVPDIHEKHLTKLLRKRKYLPTINLEFMGDSEVIIIAVPTPLDEKRQPDLKFIELACQSIANNLKKPALIINESTSFPGTLRNFIKPLIEKKSNIEHLYASAPERIDPGNQEWLLADTPRLISGLTDISTIQAKNFYETFCKKIFLCSSPEVAEAAKLFENSFRQVNIALANEFSTISNAMGFSAHEAIKAASTKPFGFMPFYPGIGVGGHCIPVDPSYLSFAAKAAGVDAKFIELANTVNLEIIETIISHLTSRIGKPLHNLVIQIAGIAYKPGVSDLRESPAINLISSLRREGAIVSWFDPLVKTFNGEKSSELNSNIDLGLIVTPHKEINFSVWKNSSTLVFDLSANSKNYGWPKFL